MENGNGDLHRPQRPPPQRQHPQIPPYPAPPAHERYPRSRPYPLPGPSVHDFLYNILYRLHHEENIALRRSMIPYIIPYILPCYDVLPARPSAPAFFSTPAAGEVPQYHMYFPLIWQVWSEVEAQIFPHLVPALAPSHAPPPASFTPPSNSSISPDHHAQTHNGANEGFEVSDQYYRYIPLILNVRREVEAEMFPPLGPRRAPASAPPAFSNGRSSHSSTDHVQIPNGTNEELEAAFFNTPAGEVPQYHTYFPLPWQVRRQDVEAQMFRHFVPTLAPHPPFPSFSTGPPCHSSPATDHAQMPNGTILNKEFEAASLPPSEDHANHAQMPNGTLNEEFQAASFSPSEDQVQMPNETLNEEFEAASLPPSEDHAQMPNGTLNEELQAPSFSPSEHSIQLHNVRRVQESAEAISPTPSASPDHAQLGRFEAE